MYYLLGYARLDRLSVVTGVPGLNRGDAYDVPVLLPPPSEQRRIAAILDRADTLRRKRVAVDALAERILPALFVAMIGDPFTNSGGWAIQPLEEITSVIHRYPTFYGVDYVASGVPVVRISDIQPNGWLDRRLEHYVRVPTNFSEQFPLTVLDAYDIVMAVRGDTTGKLGLVPPELAGANISPNLIRLGPKTGKSTPLFLFTCLSLLQRSTKMLINDTAKKSITAQNIKAIQIPAPSYERQIRFDKTAQDVMGVLDRQACCRNRLDSLFSSLVDQAFTGSLTAKWREDHMTEVLADMAEQARLLGSITTTDQFAPA